MIIIMPETYPYMYVSLRQSLYQSKTKIILLNNPWFVWLYGNVFDLNWSGDIFFFYYGDYHEVSQNYKKPKDWNVKYEQLARKSCALFITKSIC